MQRLLVAHETVLRQFCQICESVIIAPVLFSDQQTADTGGIFNGWGRESNPADWDNNLPALSTIEFFSGDPAYSGLFDLSTGGKGGSSEFIQVLGRSAVFSAVRNCVTNISTAWGYFRSSIGIIKLLFRDTLQWISRVLKTASTVMESIELAVNSIAWIPVVGWIIKIIFEVSKIITSIITSVREKRAERDQKELDRIARQYGLPMASWTPEADTMMCQLLQMNLAPGKFDLEWAFSPRYPAKSVGDFVAQRQKINPDDSCFSGWLVYSDLFKSSTADAPGLGFVPGTGNIHGAMSLKIHAGGVVKDYGDFFPITRSVSAQLWSQAVKGDSGLTFALDTERLITAWKEYVSSAFHYGLEGIGGWSMIAGDTTTGSILDFDEIPNFKFYCGPCDIGTGGCTKRIKNKVKKSNRKLTPSGNGHRNAFNAHLRSMIGWTTFLHGESLKEEDWWETMTPVKALRNMQERQEAMIRSPKCMYLDDSTSADGTGQARFRALKRGSDLHKIWQQSVTAMFESGDWKRIDYQDVIKGEDVDQAIRLKLSQMGLGTPEKYFNMDSKTGFQKGKASMMIAPRAGVGPSILGDPEPPKPPDIVEVETATVMGMALSPRPRGRRFRPGFASKKRKKKSSGLPLLLGAAGIGLLMMRGRK